MALRGCAARTGIPWPTVCDWLRKGRAGVEPYAGWVRRWDEAGGELEQRLRDSIIAGASADPEIALKYLAFLDGQRRRTAEADKALYLGLDAEGRLDALAAAELQQAHGRLRTVHRTRPGRQLHVGTVLPGGWAGLAVDVRRMPSGRPRTAAAGMDGAELRRAREAAGMGLRELGRALGVSDGTVRRYESGEREIPEAVVRAVRTLGLGAPETPLQNRVYQGVSGASSVQVSPSRGFGRSPLQGVSGAASVNCDTPAAPRRARRIDLGALTGTDDHGGTR